MFQHESRIRLALSLVAALALVPALRADEVKRTPAFDAAEVWQVHLRLTPEEYAAMQPKSSAWFPGLNNLFKPKAEQQRQVHRNRFAMDLPWAKGTATVGGETFKDVGVRYKGNGTIGDAAGTIKKSFKIDLGQFGGLARHRGRKTINLHCGVTDPSKLRETLAYGLYRAAGVPAPRTAFAEVRLTVPGKHDNELLGVYTVVEPVEKEFLRDRFGTSEGLLMKPEGLRDLDYKGGDWSKYKEQYLPRREPTADESKRVIAFARLVHKAGDEEFGKEIGSYLDADAYLRFLAATSFVSNTDSFFMLGHNYYLYLHPKTGRFTFIPWDLDRAFANLPFVGSKNRQMNLSLRRPYPGSHRLTDRLLATPGMAERYQELLKHLAAGVFQRERLLKEVEALEAANNDLLARDAEAAKARKEDPSGGGLNALMGQPPALRTFVMKRTESLAAQLAGKSQGVVPLNGFGGGFPKFGEIMTGPLLESLDANQDELLSKEEWRSMALKVFNACAKDDQGRVNQKAIADALGGMFPKPADEKNPGPFNGFSFGGMLAGPIMKRADSAGRGAVTRDELLAAADTLFDQFDKQKNGRLTEDAFAALLCELFPTPNFGPPGGKPPEGKDKPAGPKEAKKAGT